MARPNIPAATMKLRHFALVAVLQILPVTAQDRFDLEARAAAKTARRTDAVNYATEKLPPLIKTPNIIVSRSLKTAGFNATIWPTEHRAQLMALTTDGKWADAIDLIAARSVETRTTVDAVIENLSFGDFRERIAVVSPKLRTTNQYFSSEKDRFSIGVVWLPQSPTKLFRIREGFAQTLPLKIHEGAYGLGRNVELHPSGAGISCFIETWVGTVVFFRDDSLSSGSKQIAALGRKYEAQMKELNATRTLQGMDDAKMLEAANALASQFIQALEQPDAYEQPIPPAITRPTTHSSGRLP